MKRKFLLFFGFIIFLFCNIQTQASIFPHDNETNSVIIETLQNSSNFTYPQNANILPIWSQSWGGGYQDQAYGIWGNDSYLYTCGYTQQIASGNDSLSLIKWNSSGNLIWARIWNYTGYSISNCNMGRWIKSLYNRLYIASRQRRLLFSDNEMGSKRKLDLESNLEYTEFWEGNLGDGTYVYTVGNSANGLLIIKWDESGNPIWNETWGLNWGESGLSIWGTGSNLYICGVTSNYGAGGQDLLLIKWDNSGNQIWNGTWGGPKMTGVKQSVAIQTIFTHVDLPKVLE